MLLCTQHFVDACLDRAGSTQRALRLLRQFRAVLSRESSRAHLDAKYAAIFTRYTADLEGVRCIAKAGLSSGSLLASTSLRQPIHHGVRHVYTWAPSEDITAV